MDNFVEGQIVYAVKNPRQDWYSKEQGRVSICDPKGYYLLKGKVVTSPSGRKAVFCDSDIIPGTAINSIYIEEGWYSTVEEALNALGKDNRDTQIISVSPSSVENHCEHIIVNNK